jgi:RHS repeat-associated protein
MTMLLLDDDTSSFIYGPGDLPIEQIAGETVQYLHHDQQGSTRLITSASGTVAGATTFDAYGDKLGSTGSATSALGYDGQYTSADTGLVYLRARVYDPTTAQLLTVDPLVAATHEPYIYAGDEPLRYTDRSGLSLEEALEGTGIPCPWCSSAEGAAEALAGAYHAAEHGVEWVGNQLGTEELGEAAEQGAAAAQSGCELLEKWADGKVHGAVPRYPDPGWTDEELEQVADDLRDSIVERNREQTELGEDPGHRNRINEEEQLLRQIDKKLSGS